MAKQTIKTISEKLTKANDSFTVNIYDNGYMLEISGRNKSDDWATAKIMCPTLKDLMAIITEASEMERD